MRKWLASKFRTIVSGIVILRMPSSRIGPGDSPKGLCESQLDPVTFSFLQWRSVMNLLKVWLVFPAFSLHRFVFNLFLLFACFCLFVLLSENFLQTCGFNHYLTKKQKTSPNLTCLRISKLNCKKKKLRRALRQGECLQLLAPFFGWYLAFDEKRVRKRLPHWSVIIGRFSLGTWVNLKR